MKKQINDILLNMESGKICIGQAANALLLLCNSSLTLEEKIKNKKMDFEELKPELIKFLIAYRNFANELKNKGNEKGIVDIYISNYKEFNDL